MRDRKNRFWKSWSIPAATLVLLTSGLWHASAIGVMAQEPVYDYAVPEIVEDLPDSMLSEQTDENITGLPDSADSEQKSEEDSGLTEGASFDFSEAWTEEENGDHPDLPEPESIHYGYVSLMISCPEESDGEGAVFGIYRADETDRDGAWTGMGFYTGEDGTGRMADLNEWPENLTIYENRTISLEPGEYVLRLLRGLDPECPVETAEIVRFHVEEKQITELNDTTADLLKGELLLSETSPETEENVPEEEEQNNNMEDEAAKDETAKDEIALEQEGLQPETTDDTRNYELTEGLDFSSRRLILGTRNPEIIIDPETIVSGYGNIYLLQFENEDDTRAAYAYYAEKADFIEVDAGISVAEGEAAENVLTDTVMTVSANPLSELERAIMNSDSRSFDIALIDTGANGADESVSMLGGTAADDHGHGTAMLHYIREQFPDVSVLSIKALGADGKGDVSAVYAALQYAITRQVKIINLSVSALASPDSKLIEMAVDEAVQKGILVIGAAGNNGRNAQYYVPGGIASALIIGSCNTQGELLPDSNYGTTVDYLIASDSTSEAAAKFSGWLALHGMDAIEDYCNQGFLFDAQNTGNPDSETPAEEDGRFRIAELLYSGGTRISSTLRADPSLVAALEPITPRNGNFKSISFSDNWSSAWWNVSNQNIECRYLWLEPGDQTFSNTWYLMRGESGYDVKVTILKASNRSDNRSTISVNSNPGTGGLDFGMLSAAQRLVDDSGNAIYDVEYWRQGVYYEVTVAVDIFRHGTNERINAPTLYAALTDIDYGQRYKIDNDPVSISEAVIEDAEAFDQDHYNSGLYSYITASGDIYSDFDRTSAGQGMPDNTNGKATVYSPVTKPRSEALLMTFGYIRGAGSSILFYADCVHVFYRADRGGSITGMTEEVLARRDTASGTTQEPDFGYEFQGYTSDVDLLLTDGTAITADVTVMTEDQVKMAVITEDTTFTAHYDPILHVQKIDAESEEGLAEAVLALYSSDGKALLERWTTDGETHIIRGLSEDTTYILKEETFPDHYWEDETLHNGVRISISSDGTVQVAGDTDAVSIQNGVLTIANTPLKTHSLTVKKTVSGNMANRYQDFDFTVSLKHDRLDLRKAEITWSKSDGTEGDAVPDADGSFSFTLRHGQNIVIAGIPEGTGYVVTEEVPEGYTMTSEHETGTLTEDTEASFVNQNEAGIPTGIETDTFTGPVLAAAVIAISLLLLTRKRNSGMKKE